MVDEIFDRMYQDGRADLHRGVEQVIGKVAREFGESMKVLHDLQWNAPWAAKAVTSKDARCA